MNNLYFKNESQISIAINPSEINNDIDNILLKKIRDQIEGKCIKEGYVKKKSIKIINKSMGQVLMNHFNGSIIYYIRYVCELCNPVEDMIINAKIININKMGILANVNDNIIDSPLNILLAKQHHINNEVFDSLKSNDNIYVKVIGARTQFGDEQITVIGNLVKSDEMAEELKKVPKESDEDVIKYYGKSKLNKWLSTHYMDGNDFEYKGRQYKTVEHAFQAQKNNDPEFQDLLTLGNDNYLGDDISIIKRQTNKSGMKKLKKTIIDNWDTLQIGIMKDIIISYLDSNLEIKEKLINTGSKDLMYTGPGSDSFWGKVKNSGENNHGKILMDIRRDLSN